MDDASAAFSPDKTRNLDDDVLAKVCNEMKSWISVLPVGPTRLSDEEETELKFVSSANVSDTGGFPRLELPKLSHEVHTEPQNTEMEDVDNPKKDPSLPRESSSNPPSTPENAKTDLATENLPTLEDVTTPVVDQPDQNTIKSRSVEVAVVRTSVSDAPFPASLKIEQTPTAPYLYAWSVGTTCHTEITDGNWAHSFSPSVRRGSQESQNQQPDSTLTFNSLQKIPNQNPSSFLDHTDSEDTQGLIETWRTKYLASPSIKISHESLEDEKLMRCSIDPENGQFSKPIIQPDTVRRLVEGPCHDFHHMNWRQANMTSELHIRLEAKRRETRTQSCLHPDERDLEMALPATAEEPQWPVAKCVIRPATPLDFAQIAEIINTEAATAGDAQVFENEPATVQVISKIFANCAVNSRPFIVARPAEVNLLDKSKWPENSDEVYRKFAAYLAKHPKPAAPIVGFAFVTDYCIGLDGAPCPGSRFTGKVKLVVHPDHRRKLYGSALMDRIFLSVSPFHKSTVDHVWEGDIRGGVREYSPTHKTRQYTQVYLEQFVEKNNKAGFERGSQFLEKFGFTQVGYLSNAAVQLDDQYHTRWLNMVLWQSDITPTSRIRGRPQLS